MLAPLEQLGRRLSELLKEPSLGGSYASGAQETLFDHDALFHLLPYESYDPEHGVFIGRKSMGFCIEAVPLVGGDETAQKEIMGLLREIMQEGSSLQFMLWADHRVSRFLNSWKKAWKGDVYEALAEKRAIHLQRDSGTPARIFRFICSYSVPMDGSPSWADLQDLADRRKRVLKSLRSLTYAFCWDADRFLEAASALVTFSRNSDGTQPKWNPFELLSGQISRGGSLKIEEDKLEWKTSTQTSYKSFRVVDSPEFWSLNAMQQLIGDMFRDSFRVSCPFYLHFGVHMPKQIREESRFRKKSQLIENQGKSSTLLRLIPDLEAELKECDHVRRSLNQGARFTWTQLTAGIWCEPGKLSFHEQSLKSLFRLHQFTLVDNDYLHLPQFLSSLPMTWAEMAPDLKELNLAKTTLSDECANFVPLQGEWIGTPTPGMILKGRRGQLLNWNPFDNRSGNYNIVVVGRSGSGKSVFMQDLLLSGLGTGAKVFVLEVGRSFEKMCSCLSGQQIEFSKTSQICLNPFSRIPTDSEEERWAAFSMLKSVVACMASPAEGTSDYENALIEKAILKVWERNGPKATITDISRWLQRSRDRRAKTLGTMLLPYTQEGTYAQYFEGENNIDFTSPMVLIELEELKERKDLQSVVLQLFIMAITNQTFLGDRNTPFYICIDEAWDLLRGKQTGSFIETLARRLRKYNGSLVIGTQSIDDFFVSPGALAAFENSDWMCLLAQKKSSISRLSESGKVQMSQGMQTALESVITRHGEFSEVMICDADGNYSIARLELDPFSGLLYSTKAQDFSRIKALQKRDHSIVEAIERILLEQ